jgi:hypothetical protein
MVPQHTPIQDTLHLVLKGKYFNAIYLGIKTHEYREIKEHYTRKLEGRSYKYIDFMLGYGRSAPRMVIELLEVNKIQRTWEGETAPKPTYDLRLGKIISVTNYPQ